MSLADRVPGMRPGARLRNIGVGIVYFFVFMFVVGALAGSPADDEGNQTATATPDGGAVTDEQAGGETQGEGGDGTQANTPVDTDSPTATAESTPADQSFSGSSSQATDRFAVEGGLTMFDLSHSGNDGNFAVWLKNSDGERVELLANDIGQYEGSIILNVPKGEYFLDVEADGQWEATVRQPRPTSGASLSQSAQETDSDYVGPIEYSGAVRVTFEGTDDDHYGVWHLDESGERRELLVNEIGPTGEVSTVFNAQGIWFVQVETTGEWKMTVEAA